MANFAKIVSRIKHSKWTKAYVALGLLQMIVICVLQAIIAAENQYQGNIVIESFYNFVDGITDETDLLNNDAAMFSYTAGSRLERMKWENIAFIAFQVWFVAMVFDATVYQNAAEIITLAIVNTICTVVGGLEILDSQRWLGRFENNNINYHYDVTYLRIALYIEIALTICYTFFALLFLYVSYKVVKDVGWVIYKKIGPDIQFQKMYRIFQFFVLVLKIDVFIQFFVSVFYVAQFAVILFEFDHPMTWDGYYCIVVTILILPALFFARLSMAAEHRGRMIAFIIFQLLVVFSMAIMIYETSESEWYTWIVFVTVGIAIVLCTIVLAAWGAYNFGKGLKPHVQRGRSSKKPENDGDLETRDTSDQQSLASWKIDD